MNWYRILHVLGIRKHRLDMHTVEISGVDSTDYPRFCDAYIESASWDDGTELTDNELDKATDDYAGEVGEMAFESLLD